MRKLLINKLTILSVDHAVSSEQCCVVGKTIERIQNVSSDHVLLAAAEDVLVILDAAGASCYAAGRTPDWLMQWRG